MISCVMLVSEGESTNMKKETLEKICTMVNEELGVEGCTIAEAAEVAISIITGSLLTVKQFGFEADEEIELDLADMNQALIAARAALRKVQEISERTGGAL